MPNNIFNFAMRMLQNNPNLKQTPFTQSGIEAIKNQDAKAGEELAMNLCQSHGCTKEDAIKMARSFFRM